MLYKLAVDSSPRVQVVHEDGSDLHYLENASPDHHRWSLCSQLHRRRFILSGSEYSSQVACLLPS